MAQAQAFHPHRMLKDGSCGIIREVAVAEKTNAFYPRRALRLTLLAPGMVDAILDGRQPEGITLPKWMEWVKVGWRARS